MNRESILRSFGMSTMLLKSDLKKIEDKYGIDLGFSTDPPAENFYHGQFDVSIQEEATEMATHYELFYCLETSIRSLIKDVLGPDGTNNWWDPAYVPQQILDRVQERQKKEREEGITQRSDEPIDYTTFGELSEIIKKNWVSFGGILNDQKAVENIMTRLNTLRGPIAHCTPLAEDEVVRLKLTVKDWFRSLL